jgi:hypothetical protein
MLQKTKLACALSALAVLASCAGGPQSTVTPPPVFSPPPTPTTLRVLYRVLYSGTDRMTSVDFGERNAYPFDGEIYYVSDRPGSGRAPLNRYLNAGATDHADGISPPDGYSLEETLGYPWTQASLPGLELLSEAVNPSTGDYALVAPSESLPGYTASSLNVFGYPRFVHSSEVLLSLSAGGVTVESNKAAGGVTWRWFWNGVQFENHFAYGSQIQAAFYFGTGPNLNPNEAGNGYYPAGLDAGRGSPTVRFENQGNTQITRAVPLNWDPAVFGGDLDHPVIWDSLILGKDLTLNFNNMGRVAKYTTHLTQWRIRVGTARRSGYCEFGGQRGKEKFPPARWGLVATSLRQHRSGYRGRLDVCGLRSPAVGRLRTPILCECRRETNPVEEEMGSDWRYRSTRHHAQCVTYIASAFVEWRRLLRV